VNISAKWLLVSLYIIGIFIATPFLPNLIQLASSQWSNRGIKTFVLSGEIIIALFILALGIIILVLRKKISALFPFLFTTGIFLGSVALYLIFLPNPYEFTHYPEYAILSMLIINALEKNKDSSSGRNSAGKRGGGIRRSIGKKGNIKSRIIKNPYFLSALLTGIIGTVDEIYQHFLPHRFFTWYDILLNIGGGILGLLIYWEVKK